MNDRKSVAGADNAGDIRAIVIDENSENAEQLAQDLRAHHVSVIGVASSVSAALALFGSYDPQIAFIAVRLGCEFLGFKMGNMATDHGMEVVFVTGRKPGIVFESMLAAVPKARVVARPSSFDTLAEVIRKCRDVSRAAR